MQLMPAVLDEMGVADPFSPEENIRAGVGVMKRLLEKYDMDYRKALAAYNAGERAVDEHGGVPPYGETAEYVNRVISSYLKNSE
jgi:soluble lytic murein transglycosylase-like protein